jgi:cytochrome c oxidase subunit 1
VSLDAPAIDARAARALWGVGPGIAGFLSAVNHRAVGIRYMVTSFVFFLIAGVEALVMRAQLWGPDLRVLSAERYDQLFTMHGTSMMFLFVVPFLEGLSIYLVPLMIGARDMAFPRLNAFGYWTYLFAGIAMHWALLTGHAPNSGWFNYPPLSGAGFESGPNIDYWVTMVTFLEVAALTAAVELIVTVFKQRAPGMSLDRIPVFVWGALVTAFMIVFAMPPLVVASLFLALDRFVGTQFFNVAGGGEPLLWQHLFWFFGHPDVYIMLIPALGIVSSIVPTFARRPLAGYRLVVMAIVSIGFLSFGLWVHHMFAAGLPIMGMNFFAAASMMITVPTAIQIFAWIVTLARGKVRMASPLLFCVGFIVLFILGGITGIMVASVPFDWQVHDTYFVVAHFHYVLVGGVVFPIFAAIYFWFPKITGRPLSERLARWNFWLMFIGFNVTFFPMHILGLQGMPRRVFAYQAGLGLEPLNVLATAGAFLMAVGALVAVVNIAGALAAKPEGQRDPWHGATLEWATESPPLPYNFQRIPVVRSLHPMWDDRDPLAADAEPSASWREEMAANVDRERFTIATTLLDATPDYRLKLPTSSMWPFWLAVAATIGVLGAMIHPGMTVFGGVLATLALFGWHWPGAEGGGAPPPTGGESVTAPGPVPHRASEATPPPTAKGAASP